ncbi:hypothetical protein [Arsenicicoccus dermatophilus]|uniref:hypothetical protein n=1 Tax=Arsenicicoccus dermatophilus TaxID=1076331 RepID=UPI001F4CCEA2|nr:hypothetical protein [Arsenicicoccus dermatophilus]MCH8614096.1 hypothetical protein [Arsenicicoccus dermatophilus]
MTVIPEKDPAAAGALDAARRVSSLTDPRLLAVLDAGSEDGLVHIVEEAPEGATTLTALLAEGGLPAARARRVVLDVAEVLDAAASRGLHHLELTPDDVLRRRDGSVAVHGVAVEAALAGRDHLNAVQASRTDAVALAALLHAALTATWPGIDRSRLRPTPRVAGAPAPPSELVPAVPDDLEHLVTQTLGRRGKATSPGAFAQVLRDGTPPVVPTEQIAVVASGAVPSTRPAGGSPAEPTVAGAEPSATPGQVPAAPAAAAPASAVASTGAAAATAVIPPPAAGPAAPAAPPFPQLADDLRTDIEHPPTKAQAAAMAAVGATAVRARQLGQAAAGPWQRRTERRAEQRAEARAGQTPVEALTTEAHQAEPVAPVFVSDVPTGTPSPRQANFVLSLIAGCLVLALVGGLIGIYAMVHNIQRQLDAPPVARTYTSTAPAVTVTVGSGGQVLASRSATAPPVAAPPVAIVGLTAFDPEGSDEAENNAMANKVRDGRADTYWRSQRYSSDTFGNLKSGVGIAVYLGDNKPTLHQIKLTLPDSPGQDLTVYASDGESKDGALPLGSAKGASGEVTVDVKPGTPGKSYVVVWFTNSPAQMGGHYAALSEITIS